MAARKYWKLSFPPPRNSTTVAVTEVEFHTSVGGVQAATGGTPLGYAESPSGVVANAFDNNTGTQWGSISGGTFHVDIGYNFTSPVDIVEVVLKGNANASTQGPPNILLKYSDNGVNWENYSSVGLGLTWVNSETKTLLTPENIVAGKFFYPEKNQLSINDAVAGLIVGTVLPKLLQKNGALVDGKPSARLFMKNNTYKIQGSTTQLGLLVSRRVNLYHQASGLLVDTQYTDISGAFLFDNIENDIFSVVGVNPSGNQNSVIYAHIQSVPM